MHAGPVIIGFDGSPAAERALQAAAALFTPKAALVVFVWEAGRNFEAATLPERALEEPAGAGSLDVGAGFEAERAASDEAQQLAERGAALAREADVLRLRAAGEAKRKDACVILFWLSGGPGHHETWDPKPEAVREDRGPLGAIRTSVPRIQVSELMPVQARNMHQRAL